MQPPTRCEEIKCDELDWFIAFNSVRQRWLVIIFLHFTIFTMETYSAVPNYYYHVVVFLLLFCDATVRLTLARSIVLSVSLLFFLPLFYIFACVLLWPRAYFTFFPFISFIILSGLGQYSRACKFCDFVVFSLYKIIYTRWVRVRKHIDGNIAWSQEFMSVINVGQSVVLTFISIRICSATSPWSVFMSLEYLVVANGLAILIYRYTHYNHHADFERKPR